MIERTAIERTLIEQSHLKDQGGLPLWAKAGADLFEREGLPHRRLENWKYTDLRSKLGREISGSEIGHFPSLDLSACNPIEVVIGEDSLEIKGDTKGQLRLISLSEALLTEDDRIQTHMGQCAALIGDSLSGLNSALMQSGFVLEILPGEHINRPIHIRYDASMTTNLARFVRCLILLGSNAKATIVETWGGSTGGATFTHGLSEIILRKGASLSHIRVLSEELSERNLSLVAVEANKNASYDQYALTLGASLVRNETRIRLLGEGASASLSGAFILSGNQHADTTTLVEHIAPNCTCQENFRGVLSDRSRGVFQGKIAVAEQAQKTDAQMMIRSLLLSNRAEMDAKPELEIYADDVKCAHGATIGSLDNEALFYFQSRGIPITEAKRLLIKAFTDETLTTIEDEGIKSALRALTEKRLESFAEVAP